MGPLWRTEEGHPYTLLVDVYGRLVSAASEAHRAACEARYILSLPLDRRRRLMAKAAATRARAASVQERAEAEARIKRHLEEIVMREWEWRRAMADSKTGTDDV